MDAETIGYGGGINMSVTDDERPYDLEDRMEDKPQTGVRKRNIGGLVEEEID